MTNDPASRGNRVCVVDAAWLRLIRCDSGSSIIYCFREAKSAENDRSDVVPRSAAELATFEFHLTHDTKQATKKKPRSKHYTQIVYPLELPDAHQPPFSVPHAMPPLQTLPMKVKVPGEFVRAGHELGAAPPQIAWDSEYMGLPHPTSEVRTHWTWLLLKLQPAGPAQGTRRPAAAHAAMMLLSLMMPLMGPTL